MKTKFNKKSRNLIIAMLLGDGTISNNNVFKMCHCVEQKEYLEWKIKQLNEFAVRNNGLKTYISTKGYNVGKQVIYTQLNIVPFVKVLRRVFYKPYKIIGNRKMLNRLDAKGIAIWYMDDGHINIRKTNNKIHGFYIKISTCVDETQIQTIIDYFNEEWGISFYKFKEGKGYSLCCGTKEGVKFINIIKPYVEQIPSMTYKIQYDLSQRTRALRSTLPCEKESTRNSEDIVYSPNKYRETEGVKG